MHKHVRQQPPPLACERIWPVIRTEQERVTRKIDDRAAADRHGQVNGYIGAKENVRQRDIGFVPHRPRPADDRLRNILLDDLAALNRLMLLTPGADLPETERGKLPSASDAFGHVYLEIISSPRDRGQCPNHVAALPNCFAAVAQWMVLVFRDM